MPRPVRVVLACRPQLFAALLTDFLTRTPGIAVVGQPSKEPRADALAHLLPDVVVADLEACGPAHGPAAGRLDAPDTAYRVLLLADLDESAALIDLLKLGAWGIVRPDANPAQLAALVEAAAAGHRWEDQEYAAQVLRSLPIRKAASVAPRDHGPTLSVRERQIIAELADGASNADIARTLGVGLQTVKNRLSVIFDKLGVSSRLELALYAANHGLAERTVAAGALARKK